MSEINKNKNKDINDIPKRGPLPNLPNLRVNIGECPTLYKDIKKIRLKRAYVSHFFNSVLEESEDG